MVAGKLASSLVAASSATTTTTIVLDEVMDVLSLITTTTTVVTAAASDCGPCFHGSGSTSHHFSDGRAYRDVIQEFLSVPKEKGWRTKFERDYKEYCIDLNFAQYIFAVCTLWYLKTDHASNDMKELLVFAVDIKYVNEPLKSEGIGALDHDKLRRYYRDIYNNGDRCIINCLSRETRSFCDCMKTKKTEAKGMEKTEYCFGCKHSFPRDGVMKCSGCKLAMFCLKSCYDKNWPKHREICQALQKKTALLRKKTAAVVGE